LERRVTPYLKLRPPLSFHRVEGLPDGEHQADAVSTLIRIDWTPPPEEFEKEIDTKTKEMEAL
jgi:hypothetical protein